MKYQAVIFDLDGVIVSTDEYHYVAWKKIADGEGIEFNHEINNRLRGVSRMESLEIILEKAFKEYSIEEKYLLAEAKNDFYREQLQLLTAKHILPGVENTLRELKKCQVKIAIGSSSKNTPLILRQIGLVDMFDAVVDGNDIKNSKPDPEVFLLAAKRVAVASEFCLVVEDAEAGVEAALRAGMKVAGVGQASNCVQTNFALHSVDEILDIV